MISISRSLFVVMLSLSILVVAEAEGAAGDKEGLVAELFVKSGIAYHVEQLPLLMQVEMEKALRDDPQSEQIPIEISKHIKQLVAESFAIEEIGKIILEHIEATMTEDEIRGALDWLASPIGEKCTELERATQTLEAMAEMETFAAQLRESPPSADRLELIMQLDAAAKCTETVVALAMNMDVALAMTLFSSLPDDQHKSLPEIIQEIEETQPQLKAMLQPEVIVDLIYTYRSLSDAELKAYIEFASSEKGSVYHATVADAFKRALMDGSIKLGKSIAAILRTAHKSSEV